MKNLFLLVIFLFLAAGCAPSESAIQTPVAGTLAAIPTQTAYPTLTKYPTLTPNNTATPYPTYTLPATQTQWVIVVTATNTPTPINSPTPTMIPTETFTVTPTKDPLTEDKKKGFYLVGIDIATGIWRSSGESDSCYWSITTRTGNIINNHFGMAGGTMYISSNAYQVEMNADCGTWTYLGE